MSTSGGFNPASDAPCYGPRMTRAAALALRAGAGLRENCVVVITDGPTIGVAGNTSATEIELNPVSPTEFGMAARVNQAYSNQAWEGLYDIDFGANGTLIKLEDQNGNMVEDWFTLNVHQFPWGFAGLVDNNEINGPVVLTGWGTAAVAGAAIERIRIWGDATTTVDLTGLGAADVFLNNEIQGAANVIVTNTGAGTFRFEENVVTDAFDLTINAPGAGNMDINANTFRGDTTALETVPNLLITKTAGTLVIDQCDFDNDINTTAWTIASTGADQLRLSTFRTAQAGVLNLSGAGANTIARSDINGAIITNASAAALSITVSDIEGTQGTTSAVLLDAANTAAVSYTNVEQNGGYVARFAKTTVGGVSVISSRLIGHANGADDMLILGGGTTTISGSTVNRSGSSAATPGIEINGPSGSFSLSQGSEVTGTTRLFKDAGSIGPLLITQSRMVDALITVGPANAASTNTFSNVELRAATFDLQGPIASPARNDFTSGGRFANASVRVAATATAGLNTQGGNYENASGFHLTQNRTAGTSSTNFFACDVKGFSTITDNGTVDPGVGISFNRLRLVDAVLNIGNVTGKVGSGTVMQQSEFVGSTVNLVGPNGAAFVNRLRVWGGSLSNAGFDGSDLIIDGNFTKTMTATQSNRLVNKSYDDWI